MSRSRMSTYSGSYPIIRCVLRILLNSSVVIQGMTVKLWPYWHFGGRRNKLPVGLRDLSVGPETFARHLKTLVQSWFFLIRHALLSLYYIL